MSEELIRQIGNKTEETSTNNPTTFVVQKVNNMEIQSILNNKIAKREKKAKELERMIDSGQAASRVKQEYVELKAELKAYNDILEIVEVDTGK